MIKVDRDAQKTDGYQRNDNLILSESARADSIPGLEIEADDVKCSHGATAGRVDDEQVFYATTRGLTRQEAIRMIVSGFFQQVFDRITVDSVRQALGEAIGRRSARVLITWPISSPFAQFPTFPIRAGRCSRSAGVSLPCFTFRAASTPWTIVARTTAARWGKETGRLRDHLPAARGAVRHPRRPRALHAGRPRHAVAPGQSRRRRSPGETEAKIEASSDSEPPCQLEEG